MKKFYFLIIFIMLLTITVPINLNLSETAYAEESLNNKQPILTIIIDDFGGYDQSGVETMLSIDAPITCAIMPNVDNTQLNAEQALASGKEIIVHMPMQAHVNLPLHWYGKGYISTSDSKEQVYSKLDQALENVKGAKGFNIHIGSGVCQNNKVMSSIYDYSIEKNLPFVDSRTHINTIGDKVAQAKDVVYLGRDEFLEPDGDRSYAGVKHHLMVGAQLAKDVGHAIVIGHVGSHGGENTAKAIKDSIDDIRSMGVKIVPLSELYDKLSASYVSLRDNKAEENKISKN